MDADSVYSELNGKISDINYKFSDINSAISDLKSRLQDNSSRFDALRSDLNDLKSSVVDMKSSSSGDLKGAMDRLTADIQRINDTLSSMKSGVDEAKQAAIAKAKEAEDKAKYDWEATEKKIAAANEASERKYMEQAGLLTKLSKQAEEAANLIGNMPDTIGKMATKAVDDGKKEILNQWEQSKKDILSVWEDSKNAITGSISNITTPLIKEQLSQAREAIKKEVKDDLRGLIFDEVKAEKAEDKLGPLAKMDREELEEMIHKAVKLGIANTPA